MSSHAKSSDLFKAKLKRRKQRAQARREYYQENIAEERERSRRRMAETRRKKKLEELQNDLRMWHLDYKRASLRRIAFEEREQALRDRILETEAELAKLTGYTHKSVLEASVCPQEYGKANADMDVFIMSLGDHKEAEDAQLCASSARQQQPFSSNSRQPVPRSQVLSPLPPSSLPSSPGSHAYHIREQRSPSLPIASDDDGFYWKPYEQ